MVAGLDLDFLASELEMQGVVVLDQTCADASLLAQLRQRSTARLNELLAQINSAGADPIEQWYIFSEIAHRHRNRWDLAFASDDDVWTQAMDDLTSVARLVLERLHPPQQGAPELQTLTSRILTSRPGATAQRWHCDCDEDHLRLAPTDCHHRMYNVFMPLVDVEKNSDGTQFWIGSHNAPLSFFNHPHPKSPPLDSVLAPACPAGGVIIADYRTLHRGLPNIGRERHIAYTVLVVGDEPRDKINFSPFGIADFPPEAVQGLPSWKQLPELQPS